MFSQLLTIRRDWTGLFLRLALGGAMWPHGAQKLLGWFGGYGFDGTMQFFTGTLHLPWLLGFLVIVIEFFGSLSLLLGWAIRLWAAALAVLVLGIVFTSHWQHGFFMNWFGTQKGEGYEYFLLMLGLAAALMANGSGRYSLDGLRQRGALQQQLV
ncbi:DoxX family protein [Hymenobacter terrenus]|uniref:DoxX family protein n=1 Tax=Hymenobacter terrenus TaxID=1629124 RepID=UPI0006195DDE|nr:DoxX family protein [Hymenobacter terrenus]